MPLSFHRFGGKLIRVAVLPLVTRTPAAPATPAPSGGTPSVGSGTPTGTGTGGATTGTGATTPAASDGTFAFADGAGFAFALYPRDDLGPEAAGIIGVLRTDWHPSAHQDRYLYLGPDGDQHLGMVSPLPQLPPAEFAALAADLFARAEGGLDLAE